MNTDCGFRIAIIRIASIISVGTSELLLTRNAVYRRTSMTIALTTGGAKPVMSPYRIMSIIANVQRSFLLTPSISRSFSNASAIIETCIPEIASI